MRPSKGYLKNSDICAQRGRGQMDASVNILRFIMFIMERGILRRFLKQPVEWTIPNQF